MRDGEFSDSSMLHSARANVSTTRHVVHGPVGKEFEQHHYRCDR